MNIEKTHGVHARERTQSNPKQTMAKQYAEFHKLYENDRASKKTIDVKSKASELK